MAYILLTQNQESNPKYPHSYSETKTKIWPILYPLIIRKIIPNTHIHILNPTQESDLSSTLTYTKVLYQIHTFILWIQTKNLAYPLSPKKQKNNTQIPTFILWIQHKNLAYPLPSHIQESHTKHTFTKLNIHKLIQEFWNWAKRHTLAQFDHLVKCGRDNWYIALGRGSRPMWKMFKWRQTSWV